jgi:hypothetical protein
MAALLLKRRWASPEYWSEQSSEQAETPARSILRRSR